jgi:predicted nucleic acid-binding protein
LSVDLSSIQRRLKPERRTAQLRRRAVSELPAASPERIPVGSRILLDTCVYIDGAAGRLPEEVGALIKRRIQHHSSVCVAELARALGELDPRDARTPQRRKAVESIIARVTDDDRTVSPDEHGWAMVGLLAGMLRRLQGFGEEGNECAGRQRFIKIAF